jgi:uncharacterized Tic20 family protein
VIKKLGIALQIGAAFERLSFFFLILLLIGHFFGCLWVFVARNLHKEEVEGDSWIEVGNFQTMSVFSLYITSYYFTMTTITTVGYGDIGGNSTLERVICIFLQLIGVVSYSFASGSLTQILANYDSISQRNQGKIDMLNKIFKENSLPADLYYQLMTQIQSQTSPKDRNEIMDFLDDLPFRLKVRTIMYIFKESYESVNYLKSQSNNFLAWICPLLTQVFIPIDQYIYYETDSITEIYFQISGFAAFVLPLKKNIVYLYVNNGEFFGEVDLIMPAKEQGRSVEEMFDQIKNKHFNLQRQFTVQALDDSQFLTINIKNLSRMQKQFNQ